MAKYVYADGKGGIDVPDSGTPYGSCSLCKAPLYLSVDGNDSRTNCPNGHSFDQIYNWGGYNDTHKDEQP